MAYSAFNPYAANAFGGYQPIYTQPAAPQNWQNFPQNYPQAQQPMQQNGQQMMSLPTIRAEIMQVDSLETIDRCPQAPGTSQMYMTKDEANIAIRSVLANGEHTDVIYDKRPPEPPAPKLNPDDYVRRDEVEALFADWIQSQQGGRKTAKAAKTEESE